MRFDLITIFPEFFTGPLDHGILRRAREAGIAEIRVQDLREFTHDRHRTVDDRPFGGGEGMVLKPNMVVPGKTSAKRAPVEEVAEKTVRVLKSCVPASVPGIAFLSGGQSDEDATAHLDAINKLRPLPWHVTFSYGRALQAAPQKAWSGKLDYVAAAQLAFGLRAAMNGLAALGQWKADLERKAA